MKPFFVYLLRCADDSYYCGHTDNIECRLAQHHDSGNGYTATRKPIELVWQGEFLTREEALTFEQQIKGWSPAKKAALINGDWEAIKVLAKCRSSGNGPFDKLWANGGGLGVSGAELRVNGVGLGVSGAELRVNGVELGVSGAGLRVNGVGR